MSFSGKYQLESRENFEPFMKAIGLSDEIIQKIKDLKSTSEIEENGDTFKVTFTTGANAIVSNFTIGQEAELLSPTGEKVKGVVQREGNKLKTTLKNILSVTELVDANTLVSTLTLGNIVHKTTSKRM
ncbi:fatty acid-binding protein, liver-type [Haplochromis burtoni]|uniref:Fatty acid binding protein 1b, tandem duplicate 1 n=1 Tax=Haplochromis burtoni TaxID=8153 RepID=A0A3Q2UWJ7_HAPBU|nr:fatty acid-binding protein, liver-type [Haplochromis burtoni]